MSSIRIEFDTGNAAFRDADGELDMDGVFHVIERARIQLSHIDTADLPMSCELAVPLADLNGNRCGELALVEDRAEPPEADYVVDGAGGRFELRGSVQDQTDPQ